MTTSLYVFAGQSNAQRWGKASALPRAFDDAGIDGVVLNAGLGGSGTWANPDAPDWYPFEDGRNDTGELLDSMFAQVTAHLAANPDTLVDTIIWAQGEHEAGLDHQLGAYLERLEDIHAQFQQAYGAQVRLVYVPLTDVAPVIELGPLPNWYAVQSVQTAFALTHPHIQVLDVVASAVDAGLGTTDIYRDALHFSYPMLDVLSAEVVQPWTPAPADPNALKGSAADDTLFGTGGADVVFGNRGADAIAVGGGNDTVFGGRHNDTVKGKDGDDILMGQHGADLLLGGAGNDTLFGGQGADVLFGNKGADAMFAGHGNTRLEGGNGADSLFGGTGTDTVTGGRGDDWLAGGSGADQIAGGIGNDTLVAEGGSDSLQGGAGADVFLFSALAPVDPVSILDFETGVDRIEVIDSGGAALVVTQLPAQGTTVLEVGTLTVLIENNAAFSTDDILLL